jgi:hypothetical protein
MNAPPPAMWPPGPYEQWVYGPGRAYDLPQLWLQDAGPVSAVAEVVPAAPPPPPRGATRPEPGGPSFLIPTLYRQDGVALGFVPFLIDPPDGKLRSFGLLDRVPSLQGIRRLIPRAEEGSLGIRLNYPLPRGFIDANFPNARAEPLVWKGPAPKVVVALIDEGIPFAHRAFRRDDGSTRIACCWSQAAPPVGDGAVLFGREFTATAIDAQVRMHAGDEEAIYSAAGLTSRPGRPPLPLGRAASHGAFVADLLAGDWPGPADDEVAVIAVDMPATVSWDTSGFGKDMFVLAAMHYILERADQLADACGCDPLPLVMNLSFGHSGGPHDADALLPAAFDQLVEARRTRAPTALVIPSGNSFLGRQHAVLGPGDTDGGRLARLDWVLPPDDRTSTYAEIWFPPGLDAAAAGARVGMQPPDGSGATVARAGDAAAEIVRDGQVVGRIAFEFYRGRRWRAVVALAPTAPVRLELPAMTAGTWGLEVSLQRRGEVDDPSIHVRIQRDDRSFRTGGRPSWFSDEAAPQYGPDGAPATADPDPPARLRRSGTLNGLATGRTALVVAGYVETTGRAAPYSDAGAPGRLPEVAVSAPSDRSSSRPGLLAAGTRSGMMSTQRGTSSAAPQVARHLAEIFRAADPPLSGETDDNYCGLLSQVARAGRPGSGAGPDSAHRLGRWRLARPPRG